METSLRYYGDILEKIEFGCWDQLLWSLMVWYGDLQRKFGNRKILFIFSETSAACTVGTASVIPVDMAKRVVNFNGDICSLLHQYDRYPMFRKWIEQGQQLNITGEQRLGNSSEGSTLVVHQILGSIYNHVINPESHVKESMCTSPYRIQAPRPNSVCFQNRLSASQYRARFLQYGQGFELKPESSTCSSLELNNMRLCS